MKYRYFALIAFALLAFLVDRTAFGAGESANDCELVIPATCGDAQSGEDNIADYQAIEGSKEILARVQCPGESEGSHRQVICVPSQE